MFCLPIADHVMLLQGTVILSSVGLIYTRAIVCIRDKKSNLLEKNKINGLNLNTGHPLKLCDCCNV